MSTLLFVTLVHVECCKCHMVFGMTQATNNQRLQDQGTFYCPNGHPQHYTGKTEEQKRIAQLEADLVFERERKAYQERRANSAERKARAYKGEVTKTRNRVKNGVCPCCNRTFQNLMRHMETKHPKYAVKK